MAAQSQAGTAGILLVCGAPGSGKSTVCRGLLEKLGGDCRVVSVDELYDADFLAAQEALGEGTISASQTAKLLRKARMHAVAVAGAELEAHRTVLVDDTFHLPSLRKPYFNLARANTAPFLSLVLHARASVCEQRLASREIRTPAHAAVAPGTLQTVLSGLPDSDSSSKSGAIGSWEGGFLTCIDAERCRCGLALQEPKVDALSMAQTIPLRSEEVQADCMRRFSIAAQCSPLVQIGLCIKQVSVAGGDAAAAGKALAQAKSSLGRGNRTVEALKKAVQQSAAHDIVQNVLLYLP